MDHLILIGFMGAGKTTIGKLLAKTTDLPFIDLDERLEKELEMSINDYFVTFGEPKFRTKESQLLARLSQTSGIVATGGGIVTNPQNRLLLKEAHVVYLKTDIDESIQRLKEDTQNVRPLFIEKTEVQLRDLYLLRRPWYEESAQIHIETTGKTPHEIVKEILAKEKES